MTVVTTEQDVGEAERKVERDLGAIGNELDHVVADVANHTTTIEGLKGDREWITTRFEAVERDLAALPRVPEELTTSFRESLDNLASRVERLENGSTEEPETKPPEDDHEDDEEDEEEPEGHAKRRGLLNLDAWF